MTAREKVLAALGSCCAWCQTTTGPFELDHIGGGGNQHRAALGMPLADWMVREQRRTGHWPHDIQALCVPCHWRKTYRLERNAMPARKGATSLNISLSDDLSSQVNRLASDPVYGSKSAVIEAALQRWLEGTLEQSALDGLHLQIATVNTDLRKAMDELTHHVDALTQAVTLHHTQASDLAQTTAKQVTELRSEFASFKHEFSASYNRLKAHLTPTTSWWRRRA